MVAMPIPGPMAQALTKEVAEGKKKPVVQGSAIQRRLAKHDSEKK